ncbi:MAG: peptide chain release factor N(5)-glutamine methyltransferase [Gemmatimonadales bacterium]
MPETVFRLAGVLRDATGRLAASGNPDAEREARWIWSGVSGGGTAASLLAADQAADPDLVEQYEIAMARRTAGEPLAHVTGSASFRCLELRSDHRALIPRPETEGLVDLALTRVGTGRAADLGTGTGCIALSLALEGSFELVVGTDVSSGALALAGENRSLTGARVALIRSDLGAALAPGSFDLVVSNPPYLTQAEYRTLDGSVRDWEPSLALAGGMDGLDVTRRLLNSGISPLRPGGWLALEVDCNRAGVVADIAAASGWQDVEVINDLFGRARYLVARRSG